MINTYPLLNTSQKNMMGNYAGLPGTGPHGEVCSRCSLLTPDGSRFYCGKFTEMMRRQGRAISPSSPACKYFIQRPSFASSGKV